MKSKHINNVNEAILVLRHFIDLSAKLLPFLEELERKRIPTLEDKINKQKIIEVYSSYEFDTSTSKLLMNSNILDLIKDAFDQIRTAERKSSRRKSSSTLKSFLREHRRLSDNWGIVQAN